MHATDLDAIVRDVLARIEAKQHVEDSRIELKSAWPNPQKAARRIAGHANAGRGAPVLWIIGIDEKRGLVGCEHTATHNWWAQVASYFDAVVPALRDRAVSVGGKSAVALEFGTDHAPYVVKTSQSPVTKEIPWREATAIRTATRSELLSVFRPLRFLPSVEMIRGHLWAKSIRPPEGNELCSCSLQLEIVLSPVKGERLVIPRHLNKGVLWTSFGTSVPLDKIKIHPHDPDSVFVRQDQHHLAVDGGARLIVAGVAKTENMDALIAASIRTHVEIAMLDTPRPLVLASTFVLPPKGSPAWRKNWDKRKKWVLDDASTP